MQLISSLLIYLVLIFAGITIPADLRAGAVVLPLKLPIEMNPTPADITRNDTGMTELLAGPVINVWYGPNQEFTTGIPQGYINILGNASSPGSSIQSLTYTLNNSGARTLSMGPDRRRLWEAGDFNIDISINDSFLKDGSNVVTIYARDAAGLNAQQSVTINFAANSQWPLPYFVQWSQVTNLQKAVQVVDGRWQIVSGGVRTLQVGYDRVLAIGQMTWTDYEILVPVTVHAIDTAYFGNSISGNPGFGVNLRWKGHTNNPVTCTQPMCGWEPTGASAWYEWLSTSNGRFKLMAAPPTGTQTNGIFLSTGKTYWVRVQAKTNSSGTLYQAKIWADGSPEPLQWLSKQTDTTNPGSGSLLLVAHHVDVTFGNITITPPGYAPELNYKVLLPYTIR